MTEPDPNRTATNNDESTRSEVTLRDRINRVAYIVVNVSDLSRSRAFYESVTPLRPLSEFTAPPQSFRGLGLERGSFRACAMTDGNGTFATEIHLVEWTSPRTDGEAYPIFWHIGLAKMAFVIPGAKAKLAELAAHDIRPTNRDIYRNYVSVLDPDGTCVSFAGLSYEGIEPAFAPRLTHVNPSVTDIGKAMQFYGHFLGLDLAYESRPCEPIPSSQGPGSDIAQWDSHLYTARGDARVHIDISELSFPPRTPDQCRPYQSATNRGIARIGLEVDDLDRVHDIVTAARDTGVELEIMAPPEEWDLGERGRSRVLCITDPDGIRLEFVEKPRVAPIDGCRNPVNPAPVRAY